MKAHPPVPPSGPHQYGRHVRGTNLHYRSLREWVALVFEIGGKIKCSTAHYRRCAQLYRSLVANDLRNSFDVVALRQCERLFNGARYPGDIPQGYGLRRVLRRSDIGALLVETRNRLEALGSGRAYAPRPKGPRFDPARLPDQALDRLIQRHPDLGVVNILRAERAARLSR